MAINRATLDSLNQSFYRFNMGKPDYFIEKKTKYIAEHIFPQIYQLFVGCSNQENYSFKEEIEEIEEDNDNNRSFLGPPLDVTEVRQSSNATKRITRQEIQELIEACKLTDKKIKKVLSEFSGKDVKRLSPFNQHRFYFLCNKVIEQMIEITLKTNIEALIRKRKKSRKGMEELNALGKLEIYYHAKKYCQLEKKLFKEVMEKGKTFADYLKSPISFEAQTIDIKEYYYKGKEHLTPKDKSVKNVTFSTLNKIKQVTSLQENWEQHLSNLCKQCVEVGEAEKIETQPEQLAFQVSILDELANQEKDGLVKVAEEKIKRIDLVEKAKVWKKKRVKKRKKTRTLHENPSSKEDKAEKPLTPVSYPKEMQEVLTLNNAKKRNTIQIHKRLSRWTNGDDRDFIYNNDPRCENLSRKEFEKICDNHDIIPVGYLLSIPAIVKKFGFSFFHPDQAEETVLKKGFIVTLCNSKTRRTGYVFSALNKKTNVLFHLEFQEEMGRVVAAPEIMKRFSSIRTPQKQEKEFEDWEFSGKYLFDFDEESIVIKNKAQTIYVHPIE